MHRQQVKTGVLSFACGALAAWLVSVTKDANRPESKPPIDYTKPISFTQYPDPNKESGIYVPYYVIVDGEQIRVGDYSNAPAPYLRMLSLDDRRVVVYCYPEK